jgi:lysozyme
MLPSQKCVDLVKLYEGCKLKAYKDQGGVWTVGYGATGYGINKDTVWTQEQADYQLLTRLNAFASQVSSAVGLRVNQNQFDAMVSLCYNIGPAAFRGSTLVKLVNDRDYEAAGKQFLKWDRVGGVYSAGLEARRMAEMALFATSSLYT